MFGHTTRPRMKFALHIEMLALSPAVASSLSKREQHREQAPTAHSSLAETFLATKNIHVIMVVCAVRSLQVSAPGATGKLCA